MDAETIGYIVTALVTALGGGVGVGRWLLPRGNGVQASTPVGATNPGIVNTGQVEALNLVSEKECREERKEITGAFTKTSDEIKNGIEKLTEATGTLTQAVTKLETQITNVPLAIDNATLKGLQSHEARFHGRPVTGRLSKVGSGD